MSNLVESREAPLTPQYPSPLRGTWASSLLALQRSGSLGAAGGCACPPPEKDLESPSSTRLEALVPSRAPRVLMSVAPNFCCDKTEPSIHSLDRQETEFHRFRLQHGAGKRPGTLQDVRIEGIVTERCCLHSVLLEGRSGKRQRWLLLGRTQRVSRSRGRETVTVHSGPFCKL